VPFEEHDIADERANHGEAFAYRAEMADALNSLPPAQREAIRLHKVEELSLDEASKISGRSVLSLKSLVHRAVKTLRARIAGGLDG
jgi:RNA polymerase sigma-70 factor (ECF subfamily)